MDRRRRRRGPGRGGRRDASTPAPARSRRSPPTSGTRSAATEGARILLLLAPWPGDGPLPRRAASAEACLRGCVRASREPHLRAVAQRVDPVAERDETASQSTSGCDDELRVGRLLLDDRGGRRRRSARRSASASPSGATTAARRAPARPPLAGSLRAGLCRVGVAPSGALGAGSRPRPRCPRRRRRRSPTRAACPSPGGAAASSWPCGQYAARLQAIAPPATTV